ncbi:MAG: hypothetical protein HXL37_01180 [Riemerella sp.]|nr:hypothetical protein [Riemerella sp.]
MKNILLILILLFDKAFSQKKIPDFIGCYRHDNGANFCLKEDKTFLIIGFGTFITGTWELMEGEIFTYNEKKYNKFVELTPYRPELPFSVFGRKNPSIKTGYQIKYYTDDKLNISDSVYIGGSLSQMQAFFNPSPNCFSGADIYKGKKLPKEFILADLNTHELRRSEQSKVKYTDLFSFQTDGYNDFIIDYMPADDKNSGIFRFPIGAKGIENIEGEVLRKQETFSEDDLEFLKKAPTRNFYLDENFRIELIDEILFPKEFSYSQYERQLDEKKNGKYKKIPLKRSPLQDFKPLKTTLFHAECEGEAKNLKRRMR